MKLFASFCCIYTPPFREIGLSFSDSSYSAVTSEIVALASSRQDCTAGFQPAGSHLGAGSPSAGKDAGGTCRLEAGAAAPILFCEGLVLSPSRFRYALQARKSSKGQQLWTDREQRECFDGCCVED
jgi:hypothetical protein